MDRVEFKQLESNNGILKKPLRHREGQDTQSVCNEEPFSNRYIKHKLRGAQCPQWLRGEYFRFQM